MENSTSLALLIHKLDISLKNDNKAENLFSALSQYLDDLIRTDFNRMIGILYRIDVSEKRIREALASNTENLPAGQIIAKLLIDRENEKIKTRALYRDKEL